MPRFFLAARFAINFGALFLAVGIYVPFWPLWLAGRGLSAEEIGLLLAIAAWVRVLGTPLIAQLADRSGQTKRVLIVLTVLTLIGFAAFIPVQGFWPILGVTLIAAAAFQSIIPLTESLTMTMVLRERLDYGRIRLWGSLAFILGTAGAGQVLTGRDPDLVLYLILGTLGVMLMTALALPSRRRPVATGKKARLRALFTDRRFVLFIAATSLLQSSHAVYYAFSALHWRAAGLSETVVGLLWAEGVIAEVLLFAVSGAAVAWLGPVGLMLVAGVAGIARWSVLGATTAPLALMGAQILHAATFGAAHLGAMHFIARNAPPGLSASAQGVYSAIAGGLATGLVMLLAGRLYESLSGGAFTVMVGLSFAGFLFALALARRYGNHETQQSAA